jgi:hypothetical protein
MTFHNRLDSLHHPEDPASALMVHPPGLLPCINGHEPQILIDSATARTRSEGYGGRHA